MSSSRPWLFSHAIKSRIRKIALTRPSPPLRSSLRGQSARYRALLRRPGQLHLRLGGSSRPRHGPPYPLTFPLRLVENEHALLGDGERPPYGHGPWLPCNRTQTRLDLVLCVLENGSDGGEGDVLVGRPKQDIELVELLRTRGLRGPLAVVLV